MIMCVNGYSIQFYNKPKNTNNYSYDMDKIQIFREIDVKFRNFLHKLLGILLISAYGRKSNVFLRDVKEVPRFYMEFSAYGLPTNQRITYLCDLRSILNLMFL